MTRYFLRHPVSVLVIFSAVFVLSGVAFYRIPTSLLPAIDVPELAVKAECGKMPAATVAALVAPVLVAKLSGIPGLETAEARSRDGSLMINLRFLPGTPMNTGFYETAERIESAVRQLPSEVSYPALVRRGFSDIPVCYVTVTLQNSPIGLSPNDKFFEMSQWAKNVLIPLLEQAEPIAFADASGLASFKLWVIPKPGYMQAGLSPERLAEALQEQNKEVRSIRLQENNVYVNFSVGNPRVDINSLKNTLVEFNGSLRYLRDIAEIKLIPDPAGFCVADGKQAILIALYKREDVSLRNFRKAVDRIVQSCNNSNPQVHIQVVRAQDPLVNQMLNSLFRSLFLGFLLVVLIILAGYKDRRLATVLIVTVPVSVFLSFLVLYLLHISLNIISIAGLIVAIGMAIDFSIIVSDNVIQRYRSGMNWGDAIALGTDELIAPILTSALTTAAIFIPLIFLSGYAGMLFFDQALTIVVSQATAVVTAITLLPVLLSKIYKNRGFALERYSVSQTLLKRMHEYIEKQFLLNKAVSVFFIGAAIAVGIVSGYLIKKQIAPALPVTEREIVVRWNEPLTATANLERLIHLTNYIKNQVQHFEIFVGRQQYLYGDSYDLKEQEACIYFSSGDSEAIGKITDSFIRELKQQYSAASFSIREPLNPVSRIFNTGGEKIYVKLYLENDEELLVSNIDALHNLLKCRSLGILETPAKSKVMIIKPDMEKLAVAGIAPESFYRQLNSYISPESILQMSVLGSSVPLCLIREESVSWMNLLNQPVLNAQGQPFPFGHFIKAVLTERVEEYYTDAAGTFVRFAIVPSSENFNSFQHWIQQLNEQGFRGKLVVEDYQGKVKAVLGDMFYILIISVILLYLILAAQFESLVIPLIVLIELPIDFSFVLLALWISGTGLNIMSLIGLVVISGLVINDSILKIDKIIQEVRSGKGLLRSVVAGGRARLNSILITSLTTIFAVVPLMFGHNLATALQNPVSLAIAVGLGAGTLVSIYLIPALFYFLYKTKSVFLKPYTGD